MVRSLLLASLTALGACSALPGSGGPFFGAGGGDMSRTVETAPGGRPDRASDAPAIPAGRGARLPSMRSGWGAPDERPSWLTPLPDRPERYPVPQDWYRDTIARL